MDTRKRKNIIYILFVLAVCYGLYNLMIGFDKKSAELAPASHLQPVPRTVMPANTIDIEKYSALGWGRDPFYRAKGKRPVVTYEEQIEWVLNGILYDKKAPTAVINKKIVGIGDKIDGATIIEITKTRVVLEIDNSEIITLQITKEIS
ncbi:MAG: hypothetical protein DRP51_03395 [Candidatus Zixiibacteriota bacterium]|nr:MAG: hypothetical protein DRP51_03395 [candidate division Zixibacteria bacterium]